MARVSTYQTAFTSGALDPLLAGRVDVKHYNEGMRQAVNVVARIQGGFSRRPGTVYKATVEDGRIEGFAFNTEQTYVIHFGDEELTIFKDGVLQSTEVSPWPLGIVFELGITQSADTMIICHEDYQPRKLVRGATDVDWTLSTVTLENIPLGDFNDADSPSKTAEIYTLTFSTSPAWRQGDSFTLKLADKYESAKIAWAADEPTLAARIRTAIKDMLFGRYQVGSQYLPYPRVTVPVFAPQARIQGLTGAGVSVDASAYPVVTVTLDDGDADAYTELSVTGITVAASATLTAALTQAGATRREPVFSAARGWPKYPAFFEGRLWLGGCKAYPQAVFGSVTNSYYDMGLGDSLDDEGIFIVLDTDQVNAVTGLIPGRKLQVMTTGGEHVFPASPVTPQTAYCPQQTDFGSLPIKPAMMEGSAVFAHSRGKQLMEMNYNWQEDAYNTRSVSLLSQHLIKTPIQMAAVKGTSLDTSNYLYVVNADGTMAVMLSSKAQETAAWTPWETNGLFKSVCVIEEEVYALVQRDIGGTVYYLEQFATNVYTDAASLQTVSGATVISDLDHLDGQVVKVLTDGATLFPDETVVSGEITLEEGPQTVEVGLNFIPIVETMPPAIPFGDGMSLMNDQRITHIRLMVNETRALTVGGQAVPDRRTDVDPLDLVPGLRTEVIEVRPANNGWQRLPTVIISQTEPQPMTVLAVALRVEANII
jgi:hypothetical protein